MSEENLELAQRMIKWFNLRDAETAQAHSTDDVEIVPFRAAVEGTTYQGPGAFAAFDAGSDAAWEQIRFEPERFVTGPDRVVAIGHLSARARGTGIELSPSAATSFEFRGGKLSRVQVYFDVDEALKAAGMSE